MIDHQGFRIGWILLIASAAIAAAAHVDADRHFSIQPPEGWKSLSADDLQKRNEAAKAAASGSQTSVLYVAGFEPPRATEGIPLALVQWQPVDLEGRSHDEIEEKFVPGFSKAVDAAGEQLKGQIGQLSAGQAALDRARNRIVMRMKADYPGIGPVEIATFGMLGRQGIAFVHCYGRQGEEFQKQLPLFEMLADSFAFDEGHTFVSRTLWSGVMTAGLIGGAIGAVMGVALKLGKRFSKKPAAS